MKIAIFTNNYLPNPYGVSTSVEGFRKSLIAAGHTVYIFAPEWGDNGSDDENIFRYSSVKAPAKIDFSVVIPYSHKMDDIISDLDFDIIHAQHPNLLGTVASKWALKKKVPLIFTWHSLYDRYTHYTPFIPEKLSGRLLMKNAVDFANDCDRIIVPTDSIIEVIKELGVNQSKINVVQSGVDESLFSNPNGEKIRKRYNISKDKKVLVTISRLTEEKNVLFLAKSVANVLEKRKDVVFLCGGEGDLLDEMLTIFDAVGVMSQVFFTGKLDRDKVKDYLDAGDIFVYASTSETQGTIVTENMYVGKPIVAVAQKGVKDLIKDGINGVSVTENIDEFTDKLVKFIDDEILIKKLGEGAKKIAKQKYTSTACTEKLIDVYKNTIENKK